MFEEFLSQRVKLVTLDGREFVGSVMDVSGDFIKIRETDCTYIVNLKYVGFISGNTKRVAEETMPSEKMYQYPSQVAAAKVAPRHNEFSMEMPLPDDNTLGGPQLIRQTSRGRR